MKLSIIKANVLFSASNSGLYIANCCFFRSFEKSEYI